MEKKILLCAFWFCTMGALAASSNDNPTEETYHSVAISTSDRTVVVPSEQSTQGNGSQWSDCGIKLKLTMYGITKIELESVDGNALAGKATVSADGRPEGISGASSIITLKAADGSTFQPGKDYLIHTLPCDVYGGYKLTFYKDGLVAQYFGVHQTITQGSFISPTDLDESQLEFQEAGTPLVEKGRPELDEETKRLISNFRKDPTEENKQALMQKMEVRYDKVVARKKAKLRQLEREARTQGIVDKMQEIVTEMVDNRDMRLKQQFLRFSDMRRDNDRNDDWMLLRGALTDAYIGRTPVTNAEYALYDKNFAFSKGKENYPVVDVTVAEAQAYCDWLSSRDKQHTYRLPTDEEWTLGAGHMAKDVSMNAGHEEYGLTPVDAYNQTTGACGGIDFWGNCWEWTSSTTQDGRNIVKGGAWDSDRDDCRTEKSDVTRIAAKGYDNVGFRVVRENNH
jgi:formylglycine-generating enzyme required for sulfatase activity